MQENLESKGCFRMKQVIKLRKGWLSDPFQEIPRIDGDKMLF